MAICFALFGDFRGYVEFFMLQDLMVVDDYSAMIKFLLPFDELKDFSGTGGC